MSRILPMDALSRMHRARASLILSQPFFGTLALHLQLVESLECDTMATDARSIFFNPGFVATLTDKQLAFVIAHEVMHCALKHCTRRGARDQDTWNVACDYAINLDLTRAGFEMVPGGLHDPQYDGLGAEDIYRLLTTKKDGADQGDQGAGDQDQDSQDSDTAGDSGPDGDESGDESGDAGQDSGETGSEPGQDGQDEGSDASGAGSDGSEQGASTGQSGAAGAGEPEPGQEPGGEPGNGTPSCASGSEGDQSASAAPDYTKPGEVMDAAQDAGAMGEIEADWEVLTRQAMNVAKAHEAGALPGYLARLADELAKPKTDWRDVLRRFWTPSDTTRLSWNRPARRFVSSGLFLPGRVTDGVHHVAWIVDTSGSMNDAALSACRAELQCALDEGIVDRFTVLYVDTVVRGSVVFERGDEIEFKPIGGGGTRFAPAFEWLNENEPDVSAAIYFTDLECMHFGSAPAYPVMWAAYGDPRRLETLIARVPFGESLVVEY